VGVLLSVQRRSKAYGELISAVADSVPANRPLALSVSPIADRALCPLGIDQEYGAVPLLQLNCWLYAPPSLPPGTPTGIRMGCVTVISPMSTNPESVQLIDAVPMPTAVTTRGIPEAATVATLVFELAQAHVAVISCVLPSL
jgi:hypothetical protein